jgi:hypothetical protein
VEKILDVIIEALKNGDFSFLFYAIFTFVSAWLYKEFRSTLIENEKANNERIDVALQLYGDAYFCIDQYLKNNSDINNCKVGLSRLYPYLPESSLIIAIEWINDEKRERLETLLNELKKEMLFLKSEQYHKTNIGTNFRLLSNLEYVFARAKVNLLIWPLLYTLFVWSLISIALIFATNSANRDIVSIAGSFVGIINFTMLTMIVVIIGDLISAKKFMHSIKNWTTVIFFTIVPYIMYFKGPKYREYFALGMLFVCFRFLLKNAIKKEEIYEAGVER